MKRFPAIVYSLLIAICFGLNLNLDGQKIGQNNELGFFSGSIIYAMTKTNVPEKDIQNHITNLGYEEKVRFQKLFAGHSNQHLQRIYKFEIIDQGNVISDVFLYQLSNSTLFEYVEFAPILRTSLTPNDLHSKQWHLKKILAEQAWGVRTGDKNIKLAIVDDAVDINHEDLKSVIYFNASEIANNGIDDDGNGYIDDFAGWQAVYKIGNPSPPWLNRSDFTHGTHCAGIAAAATNNNLGIASIGYNISIVAVSCADSTMPGRIMAGYEGIVYAADVGVNVISLSWGGSFSNTGQQVINYAVSKGIVVCAAAGNDNVDIQMYPAAYNGVITVAATDINDKKADFSNYGTWIDISAPGVDIWSSVTGSSNSYDYLSGTSMACPMVAGLCALMLSQNRKYTPAQIENCLKSNTDDLDAKNPSFINLLGAGRINAYKSLQCINPVYADFVADKLSVCPGGAVSMTNLSSAVATSYKWTVPSAIPSSSTLKNPQFQFPVSGLYSVKLVASDGIHKDSMELFDYIEVSPVKATMQMITHKIMKGESAFLGVDMTGRGPWDLQVSDGSNVMSFNNIVSAPHYFEVSPVSSKKYFLVSVSDSRCAGTVSDTANVLVDTAKISSTGGSCGNFTLFTKTMDMSSNEIPHSINRLKNNQYVISGLTTKGDIGGKDIFLTKVTNTGDIIWTKYYGTTADETGYPLGVVEDAKGDMFIYGASHTGSPETCILIKIDSAGTILSSIKGINNLAGDHYRYGLLLKDNRIGIVGTSGVSSGQAAQVFVMKTDGTFDWTRSLNGGGTTEHFLGLEEINGKLYTLGGTSRGNGAYGSMMAKTGINGQLIWQKYIDYSHWDAMFNIIATQNSSLMLGGWVSYSGSSAFGNQDLAIIHIDTNGNRIWSKIIGKAGKDEYGGLLRINDAYYISGTTNSFDNGNSKLFVIKMDINGNVKWSKIYGATSEKIIKNAFVNNIVAGHDGSILVLGQKTNTTEDVLLLKIDECGKSNCPSQDIVFNIQNDNTTFSNSTLSDLGIMPRQNLSATVKNATAAVVSDKCPTIPPTAAKCELKANFTYQYSCAKDTADLYDSSYDISGKLIKQYKWIFYDNSVMIGRQQVRLLFPGPGTYKTTLIAFSDTPNVCSDTIVKFITVDNQVKLNVSADKTTICKGDSVHLNVELFCGQKPVTVKWYPSAYFAKPDAYITAVSPPSSMWIRCTAKDANGFQRSDSIFININGTCCKYNAMIKANTYNVCLNDTVDISNISQNTGANYKWYLSLNGFLYDSMNVTNLGKVKLTKPGLYTFRLSAYGTCQGTSSSIGVFCYPLPYINAGGDTLICAPATLTLGSISVSQRTYLWMPNTNLDNNRLAQPIATVNQTIAYTLSIKDLNTGCVNHDTINISFGNEKLNIGDDTLLCEGSELSLKAGSHINVNYLWSDGSRASSLIVRKPGIYYLTMTDKCGTYSDTIQIGSKVCFCYFFIPNAFSPNDDAANDFFPYETLETEIQMTIFNRWGEKLFDMVTNKGWDGFYQGQIVQQDVYLYQIEYVNCKGRYEYVHGTFTLLK